MAVILLCAGCGPRETAVSLGDREQVLHWGNMTEPTDLDPQIITSEQDFNIAMALFEGLTAYDPKDMHPVPGVAERWETSADGLTWTFHLRPNAKWSTGDPVTAADFVYAFRRMLTPALGAEYAYMLYHLKNAEAYNAGKLTDFNQVGVKAADEHTLVLTLWHPVPYLPTLAAHVSWSPVHRATIEKFGAIDRRGTPWTRPGNLVGNGAFVLTEWKPNQYIRLVRSPTYWDSAAVKLHEVYLYPISDASTENAAFRTGQLHVTTQVPIARIAEYKRANSPELWQVPILGTYFFRLNVTKPPLNDARVRRALALAIDRNQIVTDVMRGGEKAAERLTPSNTAGFTAPSRIRFDPAAARQLLAEAGYPSGRGFPHLELCFNTSEANRSVAEAVQQMWRKNLGIDIALINLEAKVQEDAMRQLNYQIARYAWIADYPDPSAFLELMASDSGNNQTGWRNDEYDELIRRAQMAKSNDERYRYFERCEQILADEMPIVPVYYYNRNVLVRPEVHGWYATDLDLHPLKGVYLQTAGK